MMISVGQTLCFVGAHRFNAGARDVVVTKVGRKWAQLDNRYRIDIQTLEADGAGYTSPGRCYISRAEFEDEQRRNEVWSALRKAVNSHNRLPDTISTSQIESILKILNP